MAEMVGQSRWLGPEGFLRRAFETRHVGSLLLWGPPGTGKTTLARMLAQQADAEFVALSAVMDGLPALREVVSEAARQQQRGRRTILFVDEIHRWGKPQQDALLPHVEAGTVVLIGATTENPSFTLSSALLSRCALIVLESLLPADLEKLLRRALDDPRGYQGLGMTAATEALQRLALHADGDARRALNGLEAAAELALHEAAHDATATPHISVELLDRLPQPQGPRYDRDADLHHQIISAFIKSLRGSDPDAALYWLARMLQAGEDPRFICRRLVVFAAEDVSNADPHALSLAVSAAQAHEMTGLPESRIAMAQATTYLACAPKSKASYLALDAAMAAVSTHGSLPVPLHLRNATTSLGRDLGWGRAYQDPHAAGGWVVERYLPDALQGAQFYHPTRNGAEARMADRLATWKGLRAAAAPSEEATAKLPTAQRGPEGELP